MISPPLYKTILQGSIEQKPWYWRILAFFGCKSQGEKEIDRLTQKALDEASRCECWFTSLETKIGKIWNQSKIAAHHFYNHVLSRTPLFIENIDGGWTAVYLHSLLQYTRDFRSQVEQDFPQDIGKYDQMIEELDFAYRVELNLLFYNTFPLNYVVEHIVEKVKTLPSLETNDTNPCLLLTASFHTGVFGKGHTIAFIIEGRINKYNFKIIDSNKFQDVIYNNLEPDKLSKEFFKILLESQIKGIIILFDYLLECCLEIFLKWKLLPNVNVQELVDNYLANSDRSNKVRESSHHPQEKSDCVFRSISIYMRNKLGDELYFKLKVYLTERLIEDFEKIISSTPPSEVETLLGKAISMQRRIAILQGDSTLKSPYLSGQALIDVMLEEGQNVLEKRRKKLQSILETE